MRRPHSVLMLLLLLAALPAASQEQAEVPEEFDIGNEYFPAKAYLNFIGRGEPMANVFPGEGISGQTVRQRPDGGRSWFDLLAERGFGVMTVDWPGSGRSGETINRDYLRALEAHIEAAFRVGQGTIPRLSFAQGEGAALLIKARSFSEHVSRTAVLIDPIGPQYSQPLEPMSFDEALEREEHIEDWLWRSWGFGPEAGVLAEGLDIDLDTARIVLASWDPDCFPIRPALLQPMLSPIRVEGGELLADWYVLVLRTRAADRDQIGREEALVEWLRGNGVVVETMDLTTVEGLEGTTGLPWIGANAEPVLDLVLEWYRRAVILAPVPEMPPIPQGAGSR